MPASPERLGPGTETLPTFDALPSRLTPLNRSQKWTCAQSLRLAQKKSRPDIGRHNSCFDSRRASATDLLRLLPVRSPDAVTGQILLLGMFSPRSYLIVIPDGTSWYVANCAVETWLVSTMLLTASMALACSFICAAIWSTRPCSS